MLSSLRIHIVLLATALVISTTPSAPAQDSIVGLSTPKMAVTLVPAENEIRFQVKERPDGGDQIQIPRLNNVVKRVLGISSKEPETLRISQTPTTWTIHLRDYGYPQTVVLQTTTPPKLMSSAEVVEQQTNQPIILHARQAQVQGDKLQFEPQSHKNTVGYWVDPTAFPTWSFEVVTPGEYEVQILQGCGSGQGGSDMRLLFEGSAVENAAANSIDFQSLETGHFQSFRWRQPGKVNLKTGTATVKLKVQKMAKNAAMDCRQIRLVPVSIANAEKSSADRRETKKPNVVIFYTDDQGTLDANCFGSKDLFTPYIDGLAANGVKLTQAYAHAVCCPSRAMLMTGRYPQRGRINNWTQNNMKGDPGINMPLSEVTLAEVLRDAGYRTGLIGKWHLGAAADRGPTTQGFEYYFGNRGGFIDNLNHHFLHNSGFHDLYRGTQEIHKPGEFYPDLMVEEATQYIDKNKDEPFVMFVCFNTPHYPEQPDFQFDQFYRSHKQPRQSYAKFVSTTDERMGRILHKLEQTGLRDDTIVVFQSDNGHSTEDYQIKNDHHSSGYGKGHNYGANKGGGNTGKYRGQKGSFLEGGIRTPAIISYPKALPTGESRDQAVTAMDWFPTILELCGIRKPADLKLDGHSMIPILKSNKKSQYDEIHWQWQKKWAVRVRDWKLVHEKGKTALYNVANSEKNPEQKNDISERKSLAKMLLKTHNDWVKKVTPKGQPLVLADEIEF